MATTYTVKGTVRTVGFGYNHSVGSWKSGKLCIVNDGREWRMKLYHDVQENVVRECAVRIQHYSEKKKEQATKC